MVRSIVMFEPDPDDLPGAHLVDIVSACEQVIRAAEAIQTQQAGLLLAEREHQMEGRQAFLSAAGESALARGMSPTAGMTQLRTAIVVRRLPAVQAAWVDGLVSGNTIRAIVKNLPALDDESMALFEAEITGHLPGLRPRAAAELTRSLTIEIDPDEADKKALAAREDQYVFIADEADGVATMIAHGPAEWVHQMGDPALAAARAAKNDPDDHRTRGQVMFQTLHASVIAGPDRQIDIKRTLELDVVITADSLLGPSDIPAELTGHGPIAPVILDQLIDEADQVFWRRLITDPVDGRLLHTDPTRRLFTGTLNRHVRFRDKYCRGVSCDANIAEIDHTHEYQHGGQTTEDNAQGFCITTHQTKSLPGWNVSRDGNTWTTPTGHTYTSPPPPTIMRGGQLERLLGPPRTTPPPDPIPGDADPPF